MKIKFSYKSIDFWVLVSFVVYLIIGITVYDDYGISWDERIQRSNVGLATYDYVFNNNNFLFDNIEKYYGSTFETFLVIIEKALSLEDTRDIYFIRHLFTFLLFFTAVVVFFFLCKKLFENKILALIACCMLILSPHIFAHSFYNSKDIPFLSFFLIAIASMFFLQRTYTWYFVIIHSVTTALAIDARVMGILIPMSTVVLIAFNFLIEKNISLRKALGIVLSYLLFTTAFTIMFWPFLWPSPLHNFIEAFNVMSKYSTYENTNLYMGSFIPGTALPWHYLPVWIVITTPVLYSILFIGGIVALIFSFTKLKFGEYYVRNKFYCLALVLLALPLIAVIVFHSVLYDGWRHVFFIYPLFVLLSVFGFSWIHNMFVKKLVKKMSYGIVLLSFLFIAVFMTINHPYQNVYFNFLAGDMKTVKENYELDYWGLSYRQALEYILKSDTSSQIKISAANDPCILNQMILTPDQRKRLNYVFDLKECDYFLSNYRWHKHNYVFKDEYYSIEVGNAKIMSVFKITSEENGTK